MKTKGLLLAGAIASMFAACTNEIEMSTQSVNTADRLSAGEVVLRTSFYDEDAINTRAQWNADEASWVFSDPEDRFGAMLMDTWDQRGSGIDHYSFVDYIHTNYPFHSEDGGYTWKAPENSVLCEGNYFFTYPFDPDFTSRGNVYFEIPTKQYMQVIDKETKEPIQGEDNEVTKENAVRNYQKYLGYAFIAADETVNEVNVKFHSLFANPKFKIQNLTGGTVRLIKLVVRTAQNGPAGTPALMPTKLQLAPYSGSFASETQKKYANGELSSEEETAYLFSHATKVLNGSFGENKNEGTYEYILDCGDNYEISNQEFIKLSAIMPAGEYYDFDVYAFVQLPNSEKTTGVIRLNNVSTPSWTNMDTQSGSMQTVLKPGIQQVYSASFDAGAIQNLGLQDFTVVNSEDLAWIIDLKAKDGGKDLVTIKTLGDQVELTKEVYDLISASNRKGIKWQIDGTIVIPETAEVDAIDQLTTGTTAKTTIINKANQELTKNLVNCDVVNYGTIKEGEGKVITINGDVTVKAGQIVVSTVDGDLTVEAGATATVGTVTGEVQNEGKVSITTVNTNVTNSGEATIETVVGNINNSGILVINDVNGVLTNTGNVTAKGGTLAEVNNEGQIDIVGNSTLPKLNANNGTINVKADTKVSGENYATINVENATLNCNANSETPNFYNQATGIINVTNGDLSQLEKKGYIINNGQIFVIGKSHVVVAKGSDNESGIIDITEANVEGSYQAKVSDAENNNQFFRYRGSVDKATLEKLISSHNFGTTPVILVFEETTTQNADLSGAAVRKLLVKKGVTLTISGNFWLEDQKLNAGIGNAYHSIEVEEEATMQVINGTTLAVKTTLTNAVVNGLLRVENTAVVEGNVTVKGTGRVENASADDNFSWTRGSSDLQWWK